MTTRLLIPVEKTVDVPAVLAAVESRGVKVIEATAYGNYLGAGPHLILEIDGPEPAMLVDLVQETVRQQIEKSPATFITLVSPNGTAFRVGIDDSGSLIVNPKRGRTANRV